MKFSVSYLGIVALGLLVNTGVAYCGDPLYEVMVEGLGDLRTVSNRLMLTTKAIREAISEEEKTAALKAFNSGEACALAGQGRESAHLMQVLTQSPVWLKNASDTEKLAQALKDAEESAKTITLTCRIGDPEFEITVAKTAGLEAEELKRASNLASQAYLGQ